MTGRVVAAWAAAGGVDAELAAAMLEDVVDMIEAMQQVDGAVLTTASLADRARSVAWPGMPVIEVPETADVGAALDAVHAVTGADAAAVVCADSPDLPPLLLGKLFSALTSATVAVCPAEGGGLVALAARLPVEGWLRGLALRLDDGDASEALRAAAPPRAFHVGPGWHRVRTDADTGRLDPGLEGWETTRALLADRVSRRDR